MTICETVLARVIYRVPLLWSLSLALASATLAQGVSLAPAGGFSFYLSGDDVSVQSTVGADVAVGLADRWGLDVGGRSVGRGDAGDRMHAGSVGVQRQLVARGPVRLSVSAGGLATRSTSDVGWGYGPQVGFALSVPVNGWSDVSLAATVGGVSRRAEGGDVRSFDGLVEASVGVRVYPRGRACAGPTVLGLAAPPTLLPYEVGRFELAVRGSGTRTVWQFGDGALVEGPNIERSFVDAGTYGYRVVVERCGELQTIEGTVTVATPCWEPPRVIVEASPSGVIAPGAPVELIASVKGTPPFRYRWRHPAGEDTTETLTVAYSSEGVYAVELEVSNCTGQTDTATGAVLVDQQAPVEFEFELGTCVGEVRGEKAEPLGAVFNPVVLGGFADRLRREAGSVLLVEGYANAVGADFNPALSWGRAILVGEFAHEHFEQNHPDIADRIRVVGQGVDGRDPGVKKVVVHVVPAVIADSTLGDGTKGGVTRNEEMARHCPSMVLDDAWTLTETWRYARRIPLLFQDGR